ncbi:unnamed protein product [Schistosoma margrebowiei]|uniref:Uncharacterized protein n=1 Tax=Schistosoma margrebowiei TaxID=48269 RepID=A0A183MMB4_9TREM|nr:unnamed protein product [Schistosoma margrebowiei]
MLVGGSQQETLNPGFVLLGTRQQGVPVILRELVLLDGFDPVSPSFTVRDVTTELSGLRTIYSWMVSGSPENQCKIILAHKGILYILVIYLSKYIS